MNAKEPLAHVGRVEVPWSTLPALSECGRRIDELERVVDLADLARTVQHLGVKRAAFVSCMTCWDAAHRHARAGSWEMDPLAVLTRHLGSASHRQVVDESGLSRFDAMRDELLAVSLLVEAHRDEFDELAAGLSDVVHVADRRRQSNQRSKPGGR